MAARSNNVGIMLVRLRMSAKRIKRAVLEVGDDTLSVDDLEALSRLLPSPDEAERLKAFEGDETKLAKPDQYFREVSLLVHGLLVVHARATRVAGRAWLTTRSVRSQT